MKTFARIENAVVVEMFTTSTDPARLFHPSLQWREVIGAGVACGWVLGPDGFVPPPPISVPKTSSAPINLAQFQSDLLALNARFAAFIVKSGG